MQGLPELAARRPVATLMLLGGLCLLGLISAFRLPVALLPNASYPGLTIQTEYPGIGPQKMEEIITRPLEEAASAVGGIEQIFSVSEEGKSRINVEFERGADPELKSLEMRERIDPVAARFPREVQKPVVLRYDPDNRPVLIISLDSESYSLSDLREIAERRIRKDLEQVPGISEIFVAGGRDREILVSADRELLESRGIALNELLGALQGANANASVGEVDVGGGRFPLYARGRLQSVEEVADVALHSDDAGATVRVRDVAQVSYAYRDPDSASRLDGRERVSIYIHKAGRANLLDLSNEVAERVAALTASSGDLTFEVAYDQAALLRQALRSLLVGGVIGAIFAFLALDRMFHNRLLAALALAAFPAALLISLFVLFLTSFELHLLSLSGLMLSGAIGLIFSALTALQIRRHGAVVGCARIAAPLTAGWALLSATFLPLVFSGEEMQTIYGGLAASVVFALLGALLLCVLGYPALAALGLAEPHRLAPRTPTTQARPIDPEAESRTSPLHRAVQARLDQLRRAWIRARRWLRRRLPYHVVRADRWLAARRTRYPALLLAAVAGIVLIFMISRQELINPLERRQIAANIEFPSGSSFAATNKTALKVEERLRDAPGVREVTSRVEAAQAILQIKLEDGAAPDEAFIQSLKQRVGDTNPAFVYFSADTDVSSPREITVDVYGEDLETLDQLTRDLAKRAETIAGVAEVVLRYKSPRPEKLLVIDKVKASRVGVTAESLGQALRLAIQGGVASKFVEREREVDIRIRFNERFRNTLETLQTYSIKNNTGDFIPLFELARLEDNETPVKVYRKNKKRVLSFSLRLLEPDVRAMVRRLEELREVPLPENYRIDFGRDIERAQETSQRIAFIFGAALLLIYMILAAYFESLTRLLAPLAVLPLPLCASMATLWLLGRSISIPLIIGLVLVAVLAVVFALLSLQGRPTAGVVASVRTELARNARGCLGFLAFLAPFAIYAGDGGDLLQGIVWISAAGLLVAGASAPFLARRTSAWTDQLLQRETLYELAQSEGRATIAREFREDLRADGAALARATLRLLSAIARLARKLRKTTDLTS